MTGPVEPADDPETAAVDRPQPEPESEARRAREPLDLRLVVPAAAVWVGTFLATGRGPWWWVPPTLAVFAVSVALAETRRRRRHRRHRRCFGGSSPLAVVIVLVVCLGGGLVVGAVHRAAVRIEDVDGLAASRATVTATVTVTGDPRRARTVVRGPEPQGPLSVVPARLERVEGRGRALRLRVPVLVLARGRSWSELLPGHRLHLSGRLGPARAGQPVAAVLSVRGPPAVVGRPSAVQRVAGALRAGLRSASDDLPAAQRGLLPGLVVGDVSRVPPDLDEDFRTAGLTHLTAVSGANLAIVTGFVLLVGRQVGVRGRWLPFLAAAAMAGFVVLARPQPSVVRAAAMGLVGLAALASGRPRRSLSALGAAVLVLLLADPWLSRSYGFALSVLATGGLVLLAPGWASRWQHRGLPAPVAQALAVPLAAQLACAPVIVLLSGQVSLVAVPANLLAAPVVAPATVLGVMATVVSVVHEPTAALLAQVAGVFVWWVVVVARRAASAPLAAVDWPGSVWGAVLLGALLAAATVLAPRLAKRRGLAAGTVLVLSVVLVVPATRPGWPPSGWLLAVCDVGQGDAVVLAAGDDRGVVVDAGPDPRAADACLRGLGVRRVPLVVISHLHADHVEGLPGVLRHREVGEVQLGGYGEPATELRRVLRWTREAGVPVTRAAVGDRVRVGPLTWTVVWPARVVHAGSVPNNASTVLMVRTAGVSLLLTGDVEPEAQQAMLARGVLRSVDVLKVAHHGSAHQAPELLAVVRPRVALVSVGAGNDYGHPAATTLRALRQAGAEVGRTDRDGTLVVAGTRRRLRLVAEHR